MPSPVTGSWSGPPAWLALAVLAMPLVVILVGLLTAIRGWAPNARWRHPRSAGIYLLVMGSVMALQLGGYAVNYPLAGSPLVKALHWGPAMFLVLQLTTLTAGTIFVVAMEMRSRGRPRAQSSARSLHTPGRTPGLDQPEDS